MATKTANQLSSTVTSTTYTKAGRIYLRLRWKTADNTRKEMLIPADLDDLHIRVSTIRAKLISDIMAGTYDDTLRRYKSMMRGDIFQQQPQKDELVPSFITPQTLHELPSKALKRKEKLSDWFGQYLLHRHQARNTAAYYHRTRQMILKWEGKHPFLELDNIPDLLIAMNYSSATYNERRGTLNEFFNWCLKKKKIEENPLDSTFAMKEKRGCPEARKPLTVEEMEAILNALKSNRFVSKFSCYKHSQYFNFVYFIAQTGVRNAEAIGLQVKKVDFITGYITIDEAFARTKGNSNAASRRMKETKNGKIRYLPMNCELRKLLKEVCAGRGQEDYIFIGHEGLPVDDKMFQRRVWKPILKALNIPYRNLYALRHTFATRAVKAGFLPQQVVDLLGDRLDTIVNNYYHPDNKATVLPTILPKQSLIIG